MGNYRIALIDLDGTLYRGAAPIQGAGEFVERLRHRGIQPVFFTNNSTRTPEQVIRKLATFQIRATPSEVCSSAQAAVWLLKGRVTKGAKVFYMGADGVVEALSSEGFLPISGRECGEDTACDAAILGLDIHATYQTLTRFCTHVWRLGWWILTNQDARVPEGESFVPGNGALGSFVQTATGVKPLEAGKPSELFVEYALERYNARMDEAVLIGDNLYTDIAAGQACGLHTIWVKSGVALAGDEQVPAHPDEVADSVAALFL